MSQTGNPAIPLAGQVRSRLAMAIAFVLALAATAAVVLALVLGDDTPSVTALDAPAAAFTHSGPDESRVAAAIGSHATTAGGPDESVVAAAISAR